MFKIAAVAALFAVSTPVSATQSMIFISGNTLLDQCSSKSAAQFQFCNGSIQAYFDTLSVDRKICPEAKIVANQIWDVVISFLVNNPADRHHSAASMARTALMDAYPCEGNIQ
jgi:hypothetical protein